MTPLESIPGLNLADRTALVGAGIESVEMYRVRCAQQPGLLAQLFPGDGGGRVRQAFAARAQACRAVATAAQTQAEEIDRPLLRGHGADILFVLILIALFYGTFRDRPPAASPMAQQVVVTFPNGLTPFQLIRAEAIALQATPKDKSALTSMASAVGRLRRRKHREGRYSERIPIELGPHAARRAERPPNCPGKGAIERSRGGTQAAGVGRASRIAKD